jgi:hypothetical protein
LKHRVFSKIFVVHKQVNNYGQNVPQIKWVEVDHCWNIKWLLGILIKIENQLVPQALP